MRNLVHLSAASALLIACAISADPAGERGAGSVGSSSSESSHESSSAGSHGGSSSNDGPSGSAGGFNAVPSPLQTVQDLVTLINSLPRPTTIAAFIAALPHPLTLSATSSHLSLQPAVDSDDPRIFIIVGSLVLSVVPAGPQVNDLEIGDVSNGKMSPAHIGFPISSPLAAAAPYEGVLDASGTRTVCAKCHQKTGPEVQISTVAGTPVFADGQRLPLKPFNVPVTSLISLAQDCDPERNPERCAIFDALTQPGTPNQYTF